MAEKKAERKTSGGIEFGDWKLIPMDANNWELAHRHATQRGENKGRVQWNRLGRYYQWNTIPSALRYAADIEAKERHSDVAATFKEYLAEYEEVTERLVGMITEALNGKEA